MKSRIWLNFKDDIEVEAKAEVEAEARDQVICGSYK